MSSTSTTTYNPSKNSSLQNFSRLLFLSAKITLKDSLTRDASACAA